MPANSSYSFSAGQILTAVDLNAVFAQTVAFAADSSNANTGTLPEARLPFRMNQNVATGNNVQFNDLVLTGNLTVSGTRTFVNTSVLDIKDVNITLAKGAANSSAANTAGFNIEGASVTFQYDNPSNNMILSHVLSIGNTTVNATFGFDSTTLSGGKFIGDINNFFQVVATNANTGNNASADFVVSLDGNVTSTHYINLGINNSNYANNTWILGQPYDGYLYTTTGNLFIGTEGVKDIVFFANGTATTTEVLRITAGGNVVVGNAKSGATTLTIGNTSVNATINSSSFNINAVFTANSTAVNAVSYRINTTYIANTTGVYHTGTVNAASHTVGSSTVANSSGVYTDTVNAASHTVGSSTVANSSGVYATTVNATSFTTTGVTVNTSALAAGSNSYVNSTAHFIGNSTVNTVIVSNEIDITNGTVTTTANTIGVYVGANSYINATSHFVGNTTVNTNITAGTLNVNGAFIANSTGAYHTGVVNAASHTTTGVTANVTGVYPASNSTGTALGAAANRWVLNANTINASGLITGSAGLTITGTANVSSDVNVGANVDLSTAGLFVGNSSVNTNITANSVLLNGSSVLTNSHAFTISGLHTHTANIVMSGAGAKIIANGDFGAVNYVLSSNGTGMYWADLTVSSVNTLAQYVWTNTHTHGNTTQSANVVIANGALVFTNPSKLYANSGFGTNGQILTSNGTSMFWGDGLRVFYANNLQAYP